VLLAWLLVHKVIAMGSLTCLWNFTEEKTVIQADVFSLLPASEFD
jgi:hypothetical protein